MNGNDLAFTPAAAIAAMVASGEVSAREVTEVFLARIAELDGRLGSFIMVAREHALAEAERVGHARRAGAVGPLAGVPIAIKDLIDVAGIPTTAGAHRLFHTHPARDAILVGRLRAAGAVLIGKTNLHEWAYGVTNVNVHHGPARNPWDLTRIPGGSSGGSAVAVAAGLCAGAVGTDTGGSIRIPAALCGVVGLKPTRGAVPLEGVVPLSRSLDHAGPIARTVGDAMLLFRVMAGAATSGAVAGPGAEVERALEGVRIGVPRSFFWDELDGEVAGACESALDTLQGLGAKLCDIELAHAAEAGKALALILSAEATAWHEARLRAHPEAFGPEIRARLDRGLFVPAPDLAIALRARERITRAWRDAFEAIEVLATPTTAIPPVSIEAAQAAAVGAAPSLSGAYTRLTNPFNLTGLPAVSVPCGLTGSELPVGIQFVGPPGAETQVLQVVADAFEHATRWHRRRPALAGTERSV